MGGGAVPKIPDWKIYTVGEHTPKLLQTQKMLRWHAGTLNVQLASLNGNKFLATLRNQEFAKYFTLLKNLNQQ